VLPAGLRRKMRSAVFMVLLDKRSQSEAERVGRSRKTINKALRVLKPKLEEVRRAFEETRNGGN
jgi:predicted transcriptional regulator